MRPLRRTPPAARCGRAQLRCRAASAVYYLAYLWACSVCGHAWVDDGLERHQRVAPPRRRGPRSARMARTGVTRLAALFRPVAALAT